MRRFIRPLWRRARAWMQPDLALSKAGSPAPFAPESTFPLAAAAGASKVTILMPDGLGDAILALGILRALPRTYPQWRIRLVCTPLVADTLGENVCLSEIVRIDRDQYQRNKRYFRRFNEFLGRSDTDIAINMVRTRTAYSDRILLATGAKIRIAMGSDHVHLDRVTAASNERFFTHVFFQSQDHLQELEFYRALGRWLQAWPSPRDEQFEIPETDQIWADSWLLEQGIAPDRLIILIAGAGQPIRHYRQFGTALLEAGLAQNHALVALGGNKERALSDLQLPPPFVSHNLCGRTTINQCAALLKRARLVVGNDTGLTHLACAVGTATVVLNGGGHLGRFFPYTPSTTLAAMPLACFGCDWKCTQSRGFCVDALPTWVLAAALRHGYRNGSTQVEPVLFHPCPACAPLPTASLHHTTPQQLGLTGLHSVQVCVQNHPAATSHPSQSEPA